ncbi:MAG: class I SAM-dependent RNA methyltransferase [Calditrichota bacterium]
MKNTNRTFFVATPPGLQKITGQELKNIGVTGTDETGGIRFEGDFNMLAKANRELRTASRVTMRLAEFYVGGFPELKRKVVRIPWEEILHQEATVTLRVTAKKSRLYHSDAIAERVLTAISNRLNRVLRNVKPSEEAAANSQLIIVRLMRNNCTVSVDTSGAPLHQRGYRQAAGKAPLRENLAAGLILSTGWTPDIPLVDPFCGSGTISIEAALIANKIAANANRRFRFFNWPVCKRLKLQSGEEAVVEQQAKPLILASDRDAGAIKNTNQNAKQAGVDKLISITHHSLSDMKLPDTSGWIITNPPYGERLSSGKDLRNLYARLGQLVKPGWKLAMLCANPELAAATELKLEKGPVLDNGGLSTRIYFRR